MEREVQFLQDYIDLEKIRHGDKATINFTVTGVTHEKKVPPLLLIPFVENAFKHSDIFENDNAFIELLLVTSENEIQLTVSNSYLPKNNHPGIGLENIKKQLVIAYPDQHIITINDINQVYSIHIKLINSAT